MYGQTMQAGQGTVLDTDAEPALEENVRRLLMAALRGAADGLASVRLRPHQARSTLTFDMSPVHAAITDALRGLAGLAAATSQDSPPPGPGEVGSARHLRSVFPGRETVSVTEAARVLGISRSTAYEMAQSGDLPVVRLSRKRFSVPIEGLDALLRTGIPT
jgi:excisionase family DNA binding protein